MQIIQGAASFAEIVEQLACRRLSLIAAIREKIKLPRRRQRRR